MLEHPTAVNRRNFQPAYLELWQSGELARRVQLGLEKLADCVLCPRNCHVNRIENKTKVCRTGRYAIVSSYFAHFGEEQCLRGNRGSGTIFFSWCNLRCVFCQNYEISWLGGGRPAEPEELARMMLRLQEQGCHNINLVTPEHVVPQILEALLLAVERGLRLPLVYNTSAYDSLDSLALMDGIVDIYMPDFKFWDAESGRRYAKAPDYPEAARRAIKEMHRQVGTLVTDEQGVALRGVLLRHLIMPCGVAGTPEIMNWISRELGPESYVSLMVQYHPACRVTEKQYPEINRCISPSELEHAVDAFRSAGLSRFDHEPAFVHLSEATVLMLPAPNLTINRRRKTKNYGMRLQER
ncbi:MAG: radical SAM protein [Terriglobales bacterium]|jgi:putative pyruvate formate lyase activating enzyme